MKTLSNITRLSAVLAMAMLIGCSADKTEEEQSKAKPSYDGPSLVLSAEPDGGQHVKVALETVKDKDDIVIVGRIGGSTDPWIKDRAAFSIVDPAVMACSDKDENGDCCSTCPTPWDYCCKTDQLGGAMALVKFVDDDGNVIKHDSRDVFDVKELQTVVVQGKASRDEAGNLTVLAKGMFVRK